MANRRDFLKQASVLTIGAMMGSAAMLPSCTSKPRKAIGLQLYSLRDAMQEDALSTLKAIANMGYTTLETAGYVNGKLYGYEPQEFKKIVSDLGMRVTSAHIGQTFSKEKEQEIMDWWKKAIECQAEAGCKYVVIPFMPVNDQTTLDDLKMYCDYFNNVGYEAAASGGLSFGYHNHSFEFRKIDDQLIYDFLLQNTSPNHVFFQMDVYWVMMGGYHPVDYMAQYPDRFPVLHIKDEKELGSSGKMDFKPIFEKAYANGLKEFYVEVEQYNFDPEESVKKSYDFLAEASYVK